MLILYWKILEKTVEKTVDALFGLLALHYLHPSG
jgi:hypothetical protein